MSDSIQYSGPPVMSTRGRDVLGFHLQRYLGGWLEQAERRSVLISVGFEHSQAESAHFEVAPEGFEAGPVVWTFDDLCDCYRNADARLQVEPAGEQAQAINYALVPLLDRPHHAPTPAQSAQGGGQQEPVILGFALIADLDSLPPELVEQLAEQAAEGIRAARRNAMRLFFDEKQSLPLKSLLYEMMARLPEWVGCDHSASILMTSSLEAMTLEASSEVRFDFLAERLFESKQTTIPRRLVGMSVSLGDSSCGFIRAAVERQMREPDAVLQVFTRSKKDPEIWDEASYRSSFQSAPRSQSFGEVEGDGDETHAHGQWLGFHSCDERDDEAMYTFVPMLAWDASDYEHLGFLILVSRTQRPIADSTARLLGEVGDKLSTLLRYSPLYMLNARKLWVLGQIRAALESAIADPEDDDIAKVEGLIGEVTSRLVRHVNVPSLAIAYLREEPDEVGRLRRYLRYAHPHGWTHFEQLNLPVDVQPAARLDSGISSLAVRINRPLVLSGGHGAGEKFAFKNYLYVHEDSGTVIDARSPQARGVEESREWVRLGDYYKPARKTAYATLAFPIAFGGRCLGVLTVEVERHTNWLWWTGFGAQLFWDLFASELAYAFYALGVGESGGDRDDDTDD